MKEQRKHYSGPEKVAILRLHLLEQKPVSDRCDQYGIHPTLFYRWPKEFFENGHAAFDNHGKRRQTAEGVKGRTSAALAEKPQRKNEVLAGLMEEHVRLTKERGQP
jgi:transposase-like protein